MKEISRQRQAIRDYSRTKDVYNQYRESGWSHGFYREHRKEVEAHRNAKAVYSLYDGKLPTLTELTTEYDTLRESVDREKAELAELKSKLTDLKRIKTNFDLLERDHLSENRKHRIKEQDVR